MGQKPSNIDNVEVTLAHKTSFFFLTLQQSLTSNKPAEIISYWHPNLTINLMDDQTPWTQGAVPQPLDECK